MKKILALSLALVASLVRADYSAHPAAEGVIQQLVDKHQFSAEEVRVILAQANTEQRILDSMANAAEKTKTWTAYRNSFLSEFRIKQGAKFLEQHAGLLAKTQREYGVPPQVVAAIMGVETNYGSYTGKANVLDALATLAFEHPRRGKFFTSELVEFIVLCREQGWQANQPLGSYAGAMGMSQFMPSNYRKLAVDGNGDGRVDLHDVADAAPSIANYLRHHGWQPGELVATRAAVHAGFNKSVIGSGLKPNYSVQELEAAGFFSQRKLPKEQRARVVRFNDADGDEFWLGLQNFYAISRYNPRAKYAMAVYLLSEEVRREHRKLYPEAPEAKVAKASSQN